MKLRAFKECVLHVFMTIGQGESFRKEGQISVGQGHGIK
jgi:hypothetical protein